MADPRAAEVRGILKKAGVLYKNRNFAANEVFPMLDNVDRTTKIVKEKKGPWFRDEAQPRAPGTAAREIKREFGTQDITPTNYANSTKVTKEERETAAKNNSLPQKPDIKAIQLLANSLDMKKEVRTSAIIHTTNWSAQGAGGLDAEGAWGHATAGSDTFLTDIDAGKIIVRNLSGIIPNRLLLSFEAWMKLHVAPALLAMIYPQGFSRGTILQTESLSALIDMEVRVGGTIKSTAQAKADSSDFTAESIWGSADYPTKGIGFMYYFPDSPDKEEPSTGYQYRVKGTNGQVRRQDTWYDTPTKSTWYDMEEETDITAVCLDTAVLYRDTATT
jgi:hypothetical protein